MYGAIVLLRGGYSNLALSPPVPVTMLAASDARNASSAVARGLSRQKLNVVGIAPATRAEAALNSTCLQGLLMVSYSNPKYITGQYRLSRAAPALDAKAIPCDNANVC